MNSRTGAIGSALLLAAGVDEALAGDLAEQLADGRGAAWYWRQAAAAVRHTWLDAIRDHKWLAARAVVTGWVLWAVLFLTRTTLLDVSGHGAWIDAAATALRYGNWFLIGWAIGLLHRPYGGAMALAYVMFTLVMSVPWVSRLVVTVLGHPNYNPPPASMVAIAVVSVIAGSLASTAFGPTLRRERRSPSHSIVG